MLAFPEVTGPDLDNSFVARHRLVVGVLVHVVVVGAACGGGRTPLLPAFGQASGVGGAAGGGGPRSGSGGVGGDSGASYPTQFTPAEVQAALAGCDLPHGSPVNLDTADEEAAHLVGSVLKHLGGDAETKQLRKVRANARSLCPTGLETFCREIVAAASHGLAEQAQAEKPAKD